MLNAILLSLCLPSGPLPAQTPADLVAEATASATVAGRIAPPALQAIIATRARPGSIAGAKAKIPLIPEVPRVPGWRDLVGGVIAGSGPAATPPVADRIPDGQAREQALPLDGQPDRALAGLARDGTNAEQHVGRLTHPVFDLARLGLAALALPLTDAITGQDWRDPTPGEVARHLGATGPPRRPDRGTVPSLCNNRPPCVTCA